MTSDPRHSSSPGSWDARDDQQDTTALPAVPARADDQESLAPDQGGRESAVRDSRAQSQELPGQSPGSGQAGRGWFAPSLPAPEPETEGAPEAGLPARDSGGPDPGRPGSSGQAAYGQDRYPREPGEQGGYAQPGQPGYGQQQSSGQPDYRPQPQPGYGQPGQPQPGYSQPGYSPRTYSQPQPGQQPYPRADYGQQGYGPPGFPPQAYGQPAAGAQAYNPQAYHPQARNQQAPGPPGAAPQAYPQPGYGQQSYDQQAYGQTAFAAPAFSQPVPGAEAPPGMNPPGGDAGERPGRGGHSGRGGGAGGRGPRQPGKRRKVLFGALAGVVAVAVAIALVVVFVVKRTPGVPVFGMIPTGSTAQQDGRQVASAFLTAWEKGKLAKAANLTNHPATAKSELAGYAKSLGLGKIAFGQDGIKDAAGSTTATPREAVAFAVTASVSDGAGAGKLSGNWDYHSALIAYQKANSNVWFVAWVPDVLAPHLTAKTRLQTVRVAPKVEEVTDADGGSLASLGDVGLSNISNLLMKKAPAGQGKPGLDVELQTTAAKPVKGSQAVILDPQNIQSLPTTINSSAEADALSAVGMHKMSSMVVIQPSTGKILAVANNDGFNDFALTADVSPGSTMKVITSTALLNAGAVTPTSPVACPKTYTVGGTTFHNDQGESEPAGTPFMTDFAQSCNNAFTSQYEHLSGALASTAKEYYGLNQDWDIGISGISASYFNAPASADGPELAQEAFGQGALQATPLAMASVVATVDTGSFKQPILVPGTKQLTAAALPGGTDADLKEMMRAVVTSGTAAGLGFGPNVYAKTGTADIQNQGKPNSWFVAFDSAQDVAVGCLVLSSGYGAQYAAPEVQNFLSHY
ncbi:MAG TPA: penicillin-binding transpeptidase domain-containing protein [Trebonia sp.]